MTKKEEAAAFIAHRSWRYCRTLADMLRFTAGKRVVWEVEWLTSVVDENRTEDDELSGWFGSQPWCVVKFEDGSGLKCVVDDGYVSETTYPDPVNVSWYVSEAPYEGPL